jgi:hypothetical protein
MGVTRRTVPEGTARKALGLGSYRERQWYLFPLTDSIICQVLFRQMTDFRKI